MTWKKGVWAMRDPPSPSHDGSQRVQRSPGRNEAEGELGRQKEIPAWSQYSGTQPGVWPGGPSSPSAITGLP